jgi:hypothetical protein
MAPNRSEADQESASSPDSVGFQFSLRALLVLTALVALCCGLLFAAPGWVAALTMFAMLMTLPAVWLTGMIYGPGYVRTFCTAALVPAGAILLGSGLFAGYVVLALGLGEMDWGDFSVLDEAGWPYGVVASVYVGLSLLAGTLAIVVRWMIEPPRRRSRRAPPPSTSPWSEQVDWQPDPLHDTQAGDQPAGRST